MRSLDLCYIAGKLHHRQLHAQTDTEEGNSAFAGIGHGLDLAFHPPAAKSAWDKDAVTVVEFFQFGAVLKAIGADVLQRDLGIVGDTAVDQGLKLL
jgi:hypothetical protein